MISFFQMLSPSELTFTQVWEAIGCHHAYRHHSLSVLVLCLSLVAVGAQFWNDLSTDVTSGRDGFLIFIAGSSGFDGSR